MAFPGLQALKKSEMLDATSCIVAVHNQRTQAKLYLNLTDIAFELQSAVMNVAANLPVM